MALSTSNSIAVINAACNAITALCNTGSHLRIYTGAQPGTADSAVTGTLLVDFTFTANPPFGAASSGQATANAIPAVNASNAGTAGWFRVSNAANAALWDGSVGSPSGANLNLNSINISLGASVGITSYIYTVNPSAGGF